MLKDSNPRHQGHWWNKLERGTRLTSFDLDMPGHSSSSSASGPKISYLDLIFSLWVDQIPCDLM